MSKPELDIEIQMVLDRLSQLEEIFAAAKEAYVTQAELINKLRDLGFTSAEHKGKSFTVVNNFIDKKTGKPKNVVFRPAGVKLWDIEIEEL